MAAEYQFKAGVTLVKGASRGAILDTNSGRVYSINRQACEVCSYLVEDEPFWNQLALLGLAEPATSHNPQDHQLPEAPDRLKFIWLEILTNRCNQKCIHCYTSSNPGLARSETTGQVPGRPIMPSPAQLPGRQMSYTDWLAVIDEAYELGCRACQLIGGEPLLYEGEHGETAFDLAAHARQRGYPAIEIFTNGTLLDRSSIQRLKELGVKVALSLYSHDPSVHDRITRTRGSHARIMQALALLLHEGVETRVETVVMKANQDDIEETRALLKRMGLRGKKPDPIRPSGRGNDRQLQPDDRTLIRYGYKLAPEFTTSPEKLRRYQTGHPCLYGKLAVIENGEILPCIFSRQEVLGNYLDSYTIEPTLRGDAVHHIWHTTKDDILVCQDCEYRYVCFDCRPLAKAASDQGESKNMPNPRCTYNPYTGQWGGGTWKLDQAGEPFYDQSLAACIQEGIQGYNSPINP